MPASFTDPSEEEPAADQAVDRAAALDDMLGGFADGDGTPPHALGDNAAEGMAGLVDTMLLLRQSAAADGAVPVATPAPAPRSIGRHAILRLAGEGGFATVWEGFDTVLRRRVAVKVRRPESLLSETARRRFVREAEIAARLVHPHVVTIFEVGEDQGREFIAAEFCAGGSLAAWLESHPGPLPPRDATRIVRALAGAVAYAHDAGVVHRDIKPANVLLASAPPGTEPILGEPAAPTTEGRGLTVKLGDFGLGKVDDGDGADPLTQLTRSGASIGTPAWMAPEQVDRSFGPVSAATDIHALGLLLDRLLTGRALRSGGTTAETYRQVLVDEPVPADRTARGVPRDLAAVCLRCLAKKPADRYPSAAALADDLDRWLDGRPTLARPLSAVGRATHWIRRRPIVAGLGATAMIASLFAAWAGLNGLRERRAAAQQQHELRRQSAAAELRRGFEALRSGNVAGALEQLDRTRAVDPDLAGSLAGRWLVRRTHGEREILLAPDAAGTDASQPRDLYAIALSPDGATAAVAGADGAVRLLRGLDAAPSISAAAAHDEVNDVAFAPDGGMVATVGQDGRARWWTVTAAGLVAAGDAALGAGPLYAAAFAPDGRAIAVGGEDRMVRIVRLDAPDDPAELFEFEQPAGRSPEIESILYVDERTLAASCGDMVVLLDAATGRVVREYERPLATNRNAVFGSLAVSPDGGRLMACGTDAKAHVWDVATGALVNSLPAHPAWVQGCCFVGDGTRVATACRDGGLRVFDAATGAPLARLLGHVGRVWCVVAEPMGTLLTCGADGTVRRWDPGADFETAALRELAAGDETITRVVEGPRGDGGRNRTVLTRDGAGRVCSIDTAGGPRRPLTEPGDACAIEIEADDSRHRLAVSWRDGQPMSVIDLRNPASVPPVPVPLPDFVDPRQAIPRWTQPGDLLVCSRDGRICMVPPDLSHATPVDSPLRDPVHAVAVAPTGPARVAAAGKPSAILHLPRPSAAGPTPPPLVLDVGEEAAAVAWSPDAALIACGTRTGRVLFFDAATGAARGALVPQAREIVAVAFTGDGRILVSVDDECVRISDATTRTTLDEIRPGWHVLTLRLADDDGCIMLGGRAAERDPSGGGRLAVIELDRP